MTHNFICYRAKDNLKKHIKQIDSWSDFNVNLNEKNLILAPFCGESTCENNIKRDTAG